MVRIVKMASQNSCFIALFTLALVVWGCSGTAYSPSEDSTSADGTAGIDGWMPGVDQGGGGKDTGGGQDAAFPDLAEGQICAPNIQTKCEGTVVHQCNVDGTAWVALQDCGPQGMVCNQGACCMPSCAGKTCGTDGCGGSCGDCGADQVCVDGYCETYECGAAALTVEGSFTTNISQIPFDNATASITHKQDIDPSEDGCIVSVSLVLGHAAGCILEVSAYGSITDGALAVQDLSFYADSQCPGFPDDKEGSYFAQGSLATGKISLGTLEVPDQNAVASCFSTMLTLHLEGTLIAQAVPDALEIAPSAITVTGEVLSGGSTTAKCPCAASCAGKLCGDDGCGGSCGSCPPGDTCNNGQCSCVPACGGKECGPDGCNGSCGNCPTNHQCQNGYCTCSGSCVGKECGDDGCGESCGQCEPGAQCTNGKCGCTPACFGKDCGNDGCGGECPPGCGVGQTCEEGKCVGGGDSCCSGYCGTQSGKAGCYCYCDSACVGQGDCCDDACAVCGYNC